jgi:hypothetical protein
MPLKPEEFSDYVASNNFDFIDFGCSNGGSIKHAMKLFGARAGLGIDISEKKIRNATADGLKAILYNIEDIPDQALVRFVVLSHFLEHVSDMALVRKFVEKACRISRQFVFIKQPYFDADPYLFRMGLKCFWSDWTGHPNRMTSLELYLLARDLAANGIVSSYAIYAKRPIEDSNDERIHPIDSPIDQHAYNPRKHPQKPLDVKFEFPVYYETVAVLSIADTPPESIASRYGCHTLLFRS